MDRGFVITDERLHTNLPNVYAVGDIVPGLQLAHRGFQHGLGLHEREADRRILFSQPLPPPVKGVLRQSSSATRLGWP